MLPDVSSPFLSLFHVRSFFQKINALLLVFLLCFTAYGCAATIYPPESVLKDALSLQIDLTERSLIDVLDFEEGLAEVIGVKSNSSNYLPDQKGRLLSISGRCDCRFLGHKEKTDYPFHVFLERGSKGESWRLARPTFASNGVIKGWSSYPLPIQN